MAAFIPKLHGIASRMLRRFPRVGRWEQTEDVVQDTSLRLLKALRRLRCRAVRNSLAIATQHLRWSLLDLARRYSRTSDALIGAHHSDGGVAVERAPLREPESMAEWVAFHEAVESLPHGPRRMFDLFWYESLSAAEAARRMGVSESKARRRWVAARRQLDERRAASA